MYKYQTILKKNLGEGDSRNKSVLKSLIWSIHCNMTYYTV